MSRSGDAAERKHYAAHEGGRRRWVASQRNFALKVYELFFEHGCSSFGYDDFARLFQGKACRASTKRKWERFRELSRDRAVPFRVVGGLEHDGKSPQEFRYAFTRHVKAWLELRFPVDLEPDDPEEGL